MIVWYASYNSTWVSFLWEETVLLSGQLFSVSKHTFNEENISILKKKSGQIEFE